MVMTGPKRKRYFDLFDDVVEWFAKTHTDVVRLLIWVVSVVVAAMIYTQSPVLGLLLALFAARSVGDIAEWIEGHKEFDKTINSTVGQWTELIITPVLFGLYFVIVLKFFEIEIGSEPNVWSLRPENPFLADSLNFVGGLIIGLIMALRARGRRERTPTGYLRRRERAKT